MNRIWNLLPEGLRERPFDAYTALALMAVGFYGLLDQSFPENQGQAISALLFLIMEVYFVAGGTIILSALISKPKGHPSFFFYGQIYGWAFIAAGGFSVLAIQLWAAFSSSFIIESTGLFWLTFFLFSCVAWSAAIRSFDLLLFKKKLEEANH